MGTIYKLKSEIRNFIINQKKNDDSLSCRKLVSIVKDKYSIELSKSHINSLIKASGLSNGPGRTPKSKKGEVQGAGLGSYLLIAMDALIGGTSFIAGSIKNAMPDNIDPELAAKSILFSTLFGEGGEEVPGLRKLLDKDNTSITKALDCVSRLEADTALGPKLQQGLSGLFEEVLYFKLLFSDGSHAIIDGQCRSIWSTTSIPFQFATTHPRLKSYLTQVMQQAAPLMIFAAPGYDLVPKSFLDFLDKVDTRQNNVTAIQLYGTNHREIESIQIPAGHKGFEVIIGLWPWQYKNSRQIQTATLPTSFLFEKTKKELFLAESKVNISQHPDNKGVSIRSVIVKQSNDPRAQDLIILSNIAGENLSTEAIANTYLERWPHFKEGFKEFSRAIELFTYNSALRQQYPKNAFLSENSQKSQIKEVFKAYLESLDMYLRWFFLPNSYRDKTLDEIKEKFYSLKAKISKKGNKTLFIFSPSEDFAFKKDLLYLIDRLNEADIVLNDGSKPWFYSQ